jgi:hypothetical protein
MHFSNFLRLFGANLEDQNASGALPPLGHSAI